MVISVMWTGRVCSAVFTVFLCILGNVAAAQDILHYYNLALKNDPQIKGSQFDHLASRETLRQAYSGLLPQANAEVSYTQTNQNVISSENTVYRTGATGYGTQSYGVNLTQPLFRYSSFLAVSQANSVLKRADLELEKSRQDLALRIVEAYMEVLSFQDRLAAVVAEETALASHHERAKERTTKGLAPITDRYDTEARLAAVSAQRVEVEFALKDARQALSEMCDAPVLETQLLRDEIPLTSPFPEGVESWLQAALTQNPEVQIQKYKAEIADTETRRQKAAHYPTLDFQADYVMKDASGSLYGGGSSTSTYDFIVRSTLPIYEGGLRTSKTREALNLHASAQEGMTRLLRANERKVRQTYNAVVGASNRVSAMKKSVEAQQIVVSAREERFKSGMLIGLAVLDAVQDLYKYRKEHSQARSDYIVNRARLKYAVGKLNDEDIKQINSLLQ
jgi:outer membrane protein